jgi:hypothetical protein
MKEPIKAGDICVVIDGLLGKESPNIGLVVVTTAYIGDHSKFGRIWRCKASGAIVGQSPKFRSIEPGEADFAQAWLKKVQPPSPRVDEVQISFEEKSDREALKTP